MASKLSYYTPNGCRRAKPTPRVKFNVTSRSGLFWWLPPRPPPVPKPFCIASIDFGTTYCSVGYKVGDGQSTVLNLNHYGQREENCILFHNGQIDTFGRQARGQHQMHLRDDEWVYFELVKYKLQSNSLLKRPRDTKVKSEDRRGFFLLDVLAHSLCYLKNELLKSLRAMNISPSPGKKIQATDIKWIITVPTIWDSKGKQMMREAGYKAGLCSTQEPPRLHPAEENGICAILSKEYLTASENLSLILESEAAAVHVHTYCRDNPLVRLQQSSDRSLGYLILDVGGGMVDIACHVIRNGCLDEVHYPVGNICGGTNVNTLFEMYLGQLVSDQGFSRYIGNKVEEKDRASNKADLLQILSAFETQKIAYGNTEPATGDHTEPATGDHTEPATGDHTEPATGDHTEPATGDHTEPATGDHTEPATGDHTEPTTGDHAETATGDHTEPATGDHTEPATGDHTEPATEDHTEPATKVYPVWLPPSFWATYETDIRASVKDKQGDKKTKSDIDVGVQVLKIGQGKMAQFFQPAIEGIKELLTEILESENVRSINNIICVGGFGGAIYLQKQLKTAIKQKYGKEKELFRLPQPELAVIRGATTFQYDVGIIRSRKARATYGIYCQIPFNSDKHEGRKKVSIDFHGKKMEWCDNIFATIVEKRQTLSVDDVFVTKLGTLTDSMDCMKIAIYGSLNENVGYTEEESVKPLGECSVQLQGRGVGRLVKIAFDITHSEIKVRAFQNVRGQHEEVKTVVDFLDPR